MDMNDYKLIPAESRESRMVVLERDEDGTPTVWCDPEIADLVSALNKAGIRTIASCSGHGHRPGNIMLADGRELVIARDFDEARKIDAMFPGINGEPPMVDVAGLVDALEGIMRVEARDRVMPVGAEWDAARAAIAKATGGQL